MYKILWNGKQVGQAKVEREGLYYKFTCVCVFHNYDIHRIIVSDGKELVKLGVCIPDGDKFTLSTRVPAKYLPGSSLCFTVEADSTSAIPVFSGKLFAHLDKLETARFQIINGQSNIIID